MYSAQDKARIFRERFYGRQDVYGRKWFSQRDDGSQFSGFSPVCAKLWSDGCHLKLKDGIRCDTCEIKQYVPVSDESVLSHINGEEQIIHFTLLLDDTVKFAAIDIDCKPGKEAAGYTWPDVAEAQAVFAKYGIPAAAARSTTGGFHLYLFLDDFYSANKLRSIVYNWLYELSGFAENLRLLGKPVPEFFPKQSYNSSDGIGNGIKPPMIESRFAVERNCFITDKNVMVGLGGTPEEVIEAQWQFLDTFPRVTAAQLDALIEKEQIPLIEERGGSGPSRSFSSGLGGAKRKWQPSLTGSIEKVLQGCAALRKLRDKALAGQVLGHNEGFALFHICMATFDGPDWFKKNVPGWGTTDKDRKQLEHSLEKSYRPWTCRKMQDNSICAPKTKCFEKKPPIDVVEGQNVVRNDLPESDWPEPSPVRYAFGKGEDFMGKIMEEAMLLKAMPEGEERHKAFLSIAARAQVFDEEQQRGLKAYLKEKKIVKAGEIQKAFRQSAQEKADEIRKRIMDGPDSVMSHGNLFKKESPYGYSLVKGKGKDQIITPISALDIHLLEQRNYIDELGRPARTTYFGTVRTFGVEREFEIDSDAWEDNGEFRKFFGRLIGASFNVPRQNLDGVRQAAAAFSIRSGMTKTEFLTTHGWYNDTYVMPSVIVDRDGVKPNTEKKVDLSQKAFAKNYDFKFLSDDEFATVMIHLKQDFLNTWPRHWTMICLPQMLVPIFIHVLKLQFKPGLFLEGTTGAGKTELAAMLQWFWGNFPKVLNLTSSANGTLFEAYECKDALMVLDDYKGIDKFQKRVVHDLLQYGYDGHVQIKLQRDGKAREPKEIRATTIATGEEFPSGWSSLVARIILLVVDKHNTASTFESHARCKEMAPMYQGVTPRFIHWVLGQDPKAMKEEFQAVQLKLQAKLVDRQNATRVAYNLGLNHLIWCYWAEFMLQSNVLVPKERDEVNAEHWGYIQSLSVDMISRCDEERTAEIFSDRLRQLITSREVRIRDLEGYDAVGKPEIGYVPARDSENGTLAYIYPEDAINAVQRYYTWEQQMAPNKIALGRQLRDDGILMPGYNGGTTKNVSSGPYKQVRVWVVDLSKLGVTTPLKVVGQTTPLPLEEPVLAGNVKF